MKVDEYQLKSFINSAYNIGGTGLAMDCLELVKRYTTQDLVQSKYCQNCDTHVFSLDNECLICDQDIT